PSPPPHHHLLSFPTRRSSDLHQPDSRSTRLGREERNEEVRSVRQPISFVVDPQLERAAIASPPNPDAAAGFERRVHCVVQDVDQDRKSTRLNSSHEWISYAVF